MEAPLTLISCNIRYSTTDDGPNCWQARRELLARVLNQHHPIILATQEGREPQLRELAESLPYLKLISERTPWIAERMYPCFFVDTSVVQVSGHGDIWLSETPHIPGSSSFGSAFPRLCTWVRLSLAGKNWLMANAHLDHVSAATREQQVRVLVTELKRLRQVNEQLIVMGDFNDAPTSITRQIIMNEFSELRDGWNTSEESSHHPFTGSLSTGQRIDWILTPQAMLAEISFDKSQENGRWPSDHFPVICQLKP